MMCDWDLDFVIFCIICGECGVRGFDFKVNCVVDIFKFCIVV